MSASNADSIGTVELFDRYVISTYGRFPIAIARGEGCRAWDEQGKEYLDFGAGIAVCSIGHSHPRVADAMAREPGAVLVHCDRVSEWLTAMDATIRLRLGLAPDVAVALQQAEADGMPVDDLARDLMDVGGPPVAA